MTRFFKFFAFILLLSAGFYLWKGETQKSQSYHFTIDSTGGMGPQLTIESHWEGDITLTPDQDLTWTISQSNPKAQIIINNALRNDLFSAVESDLKKSFQVKLKKENLLIEGITYQSQLSEPGHIAILENQLRQIASLAFIPNSSNAKLVDSCPLGTCEYELKKDEKGRVIQFTRNALQGLPIKASFDVKYDSEGLVSLSGVEESHSQDASGARTKNIFHLERIKNGPQFIPMLANLPLRQIGPSIADISVEQKRAALNEQLKSVSLESLHAQSKALSPNAQEWGQVFSNLKDYLWLHPEAISQLRDLLKKTHPEDRFFLTGVNALAASDSAESQAALKDLFEVFKKDVKTSQTILIALATTTNPTRETQDYLSDLAAWDKSDADKTALLSRRLLGTMAHNMNENSAQSSLIAPAFAKIQQKNLSEKETIELIDTLGNSGLKEAGAVALKFTNTSYSPAIRLSAYGALRFVPGDEISTKLWTVAKSASTDNALATDAKAARNALQLRCDFMAAECSPELREWLKK